MNYYLGHHWFVSSSCFFCCHLQLYNEVYVNDKIASIEIIHQQHFSLLGWEPDDIGPRSVEEINSMITKCKVIGKEKKSLPWFSET